jgi:predicted CopG family antitoxin
MQDILDICESKDVDVYLLDLRSLIMFNSSFIIDVALASESNEIFSEYLKFSDVFFENEVKQLSKHESHDHAIKTKENSSMSDLIYNLSLIELKILKSYIEDNLVKDFIISSVSFSSVLILFIKKKNDELRLYVNYKSLNVVTIKNKYFLSLIQRLFDIL